VGTLYHFAPPYGALGILTDMAMKTHPVWMTNTSSVGRKYAAPTAPHATQGVISGVSFTNSQRTLRSVEDDMRFTLDGDRMSNVYKVVPYAAEEYRSGTAFDEYETLLIAKGSPSAIPIRPAWVRELAIHSRLMDRLVKDPNTFQYPTTYQKLGPAAERRGVPFRVFDPSGRSRDMTDQEVDAILSLEQRSRQKSKAILTAHAASAHAGAA